jgi:hypothetical protein
MRDNGLSAGSYAAAGEVDPRLAEGVLRSLADAGIAAYTKPSVGRDQLYVDATETGRAREVVQRTTDDAIFTELIAHLQDDDGRHPWPAAEDVDPRPDDEETTAIIVSAAVTDADTAEADRVRRDADRDDDAERDSEHDHYIPPEPGPAPKLDWISKLAWTGLIGGPVVLLVAALLGAGRGGRLLAFALLAFVAGFLTLVFRMKDRPPIDDTPDDGAVV